MRKLLPPALSVALLGSAPAALAHGDLVRASPQPGGAVASPPPEVRLEFSEGVVGRFSGLTISGVDGRRVATEPLRVEGAVLVAPIAAPLRAGTYRVNWRALSVDGHKTQGSFTFEVRP